MVYNIFSVCLSVTILSGITGPAAGCHDYEIKDTQVSWCSDKEKSPIDVINLRLKMDDKCVVKLDEGSQIIYKKPINKLKAEYHLRNYKNPNETDDYVITDLWDELNQVEESNYKEETYKMMTMFGVPKQSPIPQQIVEEGEYNAYKLATKSFFETFYYGRTELNLTLTTDAGVACFLTAIDIRKVDE